MFFHLKIKSKLVVVFVVVVLEVLSWACRNKVPFDHKNDGEFPLLFLLFLFIYLFFVVVFIVVISWLLFVFSIGVMIMRLLLSSLPILRTLRTYETKTMTTLVPGKIVLKKYRRQRLNMQSFPYMKVCRICISIDFMAIRRHCLMFSSSRYCYTYPKRKQVTVFEVISVRSWRLALQSDIWRSNSLPMRPFLLNPNKNLPFHLRAASSQYLVWWLVRSIAMQQAFDWRRIARIYNNWTIMRGGPRNLSGDVPSEKHIYIKV